MQLLADILTDILRLACNGLADVLGLSGEGLADFLGLGGDALAEILGGGAPGRSWGREILPTSWAGGRVLPACACGETWLICRLRGKALAQSLCLLGEITLDRPRLLLGLRPLL